GEHANRPIEARERRYALRTHAHAGRDWLERPPLSSHGSLKSVARGLAEALVVGPWREDDLVERGAAALGWRWLRPLTRRLAAAFDSGMRPRSARVVEFLLGDEPFRRAHRKHQFGLTE